MTGQKKRSLARHEARWGLVFISPWLFGFLVFTVGPMLTSLWLSFTKYDLHTMEFVGIENFRRLATRDPLFWKALSNTLLYAVISVPLGIAGSLGLAILLNQKVRGQHLFRTLFYLPSMVPAVASAILWQWMFNTDNGAINSGLGFFSIPPIQWLQDEHWTMPAFVLMSLWGIGGARMIIFLAGLQGCVG